MARVERRDEVTPTKLGKATRREQTKAPTKVRRTDDPQTLVGLIWRVSEDPTRVVMLIVLLAAVAAMLSVLLAVMAPVWVHVSVAGGVGCGALLVSTFLRQARHNKWTSRQRKPGPPGSR
jgi:hypothetical protein